MPTHRVGRLEMHYEIHGAGDPIVLIAGYTCDSTFWDAVVPGLASRHQLIVFDNRAVGRTRDDGRPFTVDTMAADTVGLIRHLGLSRPGLVGQSMGGAIVQAMLNAYPDACGACAMVDSTHAFSRTTLLALETLLALRKAGADLGLLVDTALPWFAGKDWLAVPENVVQLKTALARHPAPQSLADQERQLQALRTFHAGARDAPWRYPALVVSATEDVITTPVEGQALAASLGGTYVEVPGGHQTRVEQPARLAALLDSFFTCGKP
ncbi:hypothetical protein CAL12_11575 [Bordetella genomosp. 8]|uniref:AB hydrolase-1 domain-containing protein n=1 Tax=Bordetella genomosp. 8 TaxID=1416806 RepID=A0A1W6YJY8_9BORD|nr:alpha/beta hydrolase [Bordetella genomosp. 8]ARP81372.1 hypothetical protein CAL12_11575 [Bordetella genomosp. 8]